uniref:Uncharacterized protein n=1 Tax=Manihot esculenta TaxID=3983 RepID=A0A2C9U5F1_MANES
MECLFCNVCDFCLCMLSYVQIDFHLQMDNSFVNLFVIQVSYSFVNPLMILMTNLFVNPFVIQIANIFINSLTRND